jgi:Zn finger protein HypA/HybF involved in hydrogenase expression
VTREPREVGIVAEAYCVKCKAKKEIAKAQEVTMKNGRPALQGVCPDCGTKLFRIMGGKK